MAEGSLTFTELETAATQATPATSTEQAPATPVVEAPATTETKPQFTDADVQAYQQLVDMGITPQNAAQFKEAKTALDNLPVLMKSPEGLRILMDEIQKNDPEAYKTVKEYVSDRWWNDLPESTKNASGNGSQSRTADSTPAVDPEIATMKREWAQIKNERIQAETAKQTAALNEKFNNSLDALVAKLPENIPADKREHIRLKAEKLIWSDNAARNRINQGVFTDVPTYFSKASSLVTAETKASANAEHDRRAGVEARGSREIPAAAENMNGSASSKQEGHGHDPIWGDISSNELKSAYK
jgi:hypothetical protein